MHTTCIAPHVVQASAVLADPAIRLIVETPPVSVRTHSGLFLRRHVGIHVCCNCRQRIIMFEICCHVGIVIIIVIT